MGALNPRLCIPIQIRMLESAAAGDRSAMDEAAAANRAERERLAAELESTRGDLNTSRQVQKRRGYGVLPIG